MDAGPYLAATVTQRLRRFLDDTGGAPPAWATVDDVLDSLWSTLRARRGDETFWRRFSSLLADVRATAGSRDRLADPAAESLADARIADLVRELQRALDSARPDAGPGTLRRLLPRLSAPLATGLLLVGSSLACGPATHDVAPPDPGPPCLASYVDGSRLPLDEQRELHACLPELPQSRQDELLALFRDASPEAIARTLEGLLHRGAECGPADEAYEPPGYDDGSMVPVYKGVSFE